MFRKSRWDRYRSVMASNVNVVGLHCVRPIHYYAFTNPSLSALPLCGNLPCIAALPVEEELLSVKLLRTVQLELGCVARRLDNAMHEACNILLCPKIVTNIMQEPLCRWLGNIWLTKFPIPCCFAMISKARQADWDVLILQLYLSGALQDFITHKLFSMRHVEEQRMRDHVIEALLASYIVKANSRDGETTNLAILDDADLKNTARVVLNTSDTDMLLNMLAMAQAEDQVSISCTISSPFLPIKLLILLVSRINTFWTTNEIVLLLRKTMQVLPAFYLLSILAYWRHLLTNTLGCFNRTKREQSL